MKYTGLSEKLIERINKDQVEGYRCPFAAKDEEIVRRKMDHDQANLWRPGYVRDCEKILYIPYYNRYTDKTQVFSFYKNDDISRRALHVQLVSRIARNIGRVLGLNLDLIEAIALGHDIGHTPFGHAGERILSEIYEDRCGRYFNHNVQSARVLDNLFCRNISLQTLDGILCHNGEFEMKKYEPLPLADFADFDSRMEKCYTAKDAIDKLIPNTLEGCVVRVSDMIAYLGKDRQDARQAHILTGDNPFTKGKIGVENSEIINNLVVNIIENSYDKEYIRLDDEYFNALKTAKSENYTHIYQNEAMDRIYEENIRPMFYELFDLLLKDVTNENRESIIYKHHINLLNTQQGYYMDCPVYEQNKKEDIVIDYLASMTDDYFVELYRYLFPKGKYDIRYVSYFE